MPTYTFKTPEGELLTKRLSFADYDAVQSGEKVLTTESGQTLELVFDPGTVGFVLKDGESGGWAGKALKENKYRAGRSHEMARRERDHAPKTRLIPNFEGQEAHSWADVQDHARVTRGEVSASTYDHLVAGETKGAST